MSDPTPETFDALVLGGGIAGLAAAHTLAADGQRTILVERSDRPGGSVLTLREEGYLVEGGPHTLRVADPGLLDWLSGLGLGAETVRENPESRKRYIVRRGRPVALPHSLPSALFGPWLPLSGKLRLLAEPLLHGRPPEGEESVAAFARRHFGEATVRHLVDPFVGGIFAGDPARLSVGQAFPLLTEVERDFGSILTGFPKRARRQRKEKGPRFRPVTLNFREGLATLTEHLARTGGFRTLTGTSPHRITPADDGWFVELPGQRLTARRLVVALPPAALAGLPLETGTPHDLSPFATTESPPVSVVSLGYRREEIGHPLDGFGLLCPSSEGRNILGILFPSSIFPGRTPDPDHILLSTFVGGARNPEAAAGTDDELFQLAHGENRELLAATGAPAFARVTRWNRAIPQYNLGYGVAAGTLGLIEGKAPHPIRFCGNSRGGISLAHSLASGREAATSLLSC